MLVYYRGLQNKTDRNILHILKSIVFQKYLNNLLVLSSFLLVFSVLFCFVFFCFTLLCLFWFYFFWILFCYILLYLIFLYLVLFLFSSLFFFILILI